MTDRIKKSVVLAASVLAALLAAGCGSGKDTVSTVLDTAGFADEVHAAPERAMEAGTARFELKIEVKAGRQKSSGTSKGEMDFVNRSAKQTMKIDGHTVDHVVVGGNSYMRGLTSDEWTVEPVAALQRRAGMNPEGAQGMDPLGQVDELASLQNIEFVGEEKVRGAAAKHYRGYTDIVAESANMAAGDPEAERIARIVEAVFPDPMVPTDVWIDSEGRAVRTKMAAVYDWEAGARKVPELQQAADEIGKMTMTFQLEFFDWGIPVDIEVPDEFR